MLPQWTFLIWNKHNFILYKKWMINIWTLLFWSYFGWIWQNYINILSSKCINLYCICHLWAHQLTWIKSCGIIMIGIVSKLDNNGKLGLFRLMCKNVSTWMVLSLSYFCTIVESITTSNSETCRFLTQNSVSCYYSNHCNSNEINRKLPMINTTVTLKCY